LFHSHFRRRFLSVVWSSLGAMGWEAVTAAFDALDAALDGVLELDFEALSTQERLVSLQRVERVRRRLPAAEHPLVNQLARTSQPGFPPGP
jgi:hypothetical protein